MSPVAHRPSIRPGRALAAGAALVLAAATPLPGQTSGGHAHGPGGSHTHGAATSGGAADDPMAGMAEHAMSGMDHGAHSAATLRHMEMSPLRVGTHDDTVRARAVAAELRSAIARYKNVKVAEEDGYAMFLPGVKEQRVFHFTRRSNALREAFRFDPAQPTSLLYRRAADGGMALIGAMYTMPRRASLETLDARIPLSIAQWHRHVNWCLPPRGERERFGERRNGAPVFGPESPIATQAECDAVGGTFHPSLFGWMVHVNVFAGDDLHAIFADDDHGK